MSDKKVQNDKDTVIAKFKESVNKSKYENAIVYKDRMVSYYELDRLSDNIAKNLIREGLSHGDTIGIYMDKSEKFIVSLLGILKVGASYLPLDIIYPMYRIDNMLKQCNAKYVLSESITNDMLEKQFLYDDLIREPQVDINIGTCSGSDVAYIMFTSGSMGNPKGIPMRHNSIVNLVESLKERIGLDFKTISVLAAVVFDMSVAQIYFGLFCGKTITIIPNEFKILPSELLKYIKEKRIDVLDITPQHLNAINSYLKIQKDAKFACKKIIVAGEALPIQTVREFYELTSTGNCEVYNCYGPTEACVYVTTYKITKNSIDNLQQMLIGKPIKNTSIYILDQDLQPCKPGEIGELYISGLGLTHGYVNNEELTKQVFKKNPFADGLIYKSGDLARLNEDGNLICLGRIDNQVKIKGYRIELEEVEYHLRKIEQIDQIVVVANKKGNKDIFAGFYVSCMELSLNMIKEKLLLDLPHFMIPDVMIRVDNIPVTINGKVDKKRLLELLEEYDEGRNTDLEWNEGHTVLQLCKKILENNSISVNDSFFEVGGDSLNIIELYSEIYDKYMINLDISDIYKSKTIKEIIELVDTQSLGSSKESVENNVNSNANEQYQGTQNIPALALQSLCIKNEKTQDLKRDKYNLHKYPTYNVIHYITLNKRVDPTRLENAVSEVVALYDAFRMVFNRNRNVIYAKLENAAVNSFRYIVCDKPLTNTYVKSYAKNFDYKQLPLYEIVLLEYNNDQKILLNSHHAIFDFFSIRIFINDILKVYLDKPCNAYNKSFMNEIYRKSIQENKDLLYFWEEYYKDRKSSVNFIGDLNDNYRITIDNLFSEVEFHVGSNRFNQIKVVTKQLGISTYTFLFSIFALVLGSSNRKEDIIIGTYLPNRHHNNSSIIGLFTKMIGVRFKYSNDISIMEYLCEQHKNISKVMEHDQIDQFDVFKNMSIEEISKGPLFEVIFNYVSEITVKEDPFILTSVDISEEPEELPYSIKAYEYNNDVVFKAKYAQEIYSKELINKIHTQYVQLIDKVLVNSDCKEKIDQVW